MTWRDHCSSREVDRHKLLLHIGESSLVLPSHAYGLGRLQSRLPVIALTWLTGLQAHCQGPDLPG